MNMGKNTFLRASKLRNFVSMHAVLNWVVLIMFLPENSNLNVHLRADPYNNFACQLFSIDVVKQIVKLG